MPHQHQKSAFFINSDNTLAAGIRKLKRVSIRRPVPTSKFGMALVAPMPPNAPIP
jgi:hypothetical protein